MLRKIRVMDSFGRRGDAKGNGGFPHEELPLAQRKAFSSLSETLTRTRGNALAWQLLETLRERLERACVLLQRSKLRVASPRERHPLASAASESSPKGRCQGRTSVRGGFFTPCCTSYWTNDK
ncbi:hypothetical protein [Nostoc sp. ChiQUE01b]|uniref:hypothetical protein n=1 Tax=Nostoc sp. ChiQUE01b TaxID=3075376 RepID=UPI002AD23CDA|nr:hypothetical protein [Nostoc sp. ChiQUE01b]